jgi:tRNA A37 methylthiotransferase MiaB
MRRPERAATIRERVHRRRAAHPHHPHRTPVNAGFPVETEDDYDGRL